MIARIWHGRTLASDADAAIDYMRRTGVPMYRETPGNRGIYFLRSTRDGITDIRLLTFWDSLEDVQRFTGPDPARAVYFPEDERYLLELEPEVVHLEVSQE